MTWFLSAGSKLTRFSVGIVIGLGLCGPKMTWFLLIVWGSIDLVLVSMIEIDLFLVYGPKRTWFMY